MDPSIEAQILLRYLRSQCLGLANAQKRHTVFANIRGPIEMQTGKTYSDSALRGFKQELSNAGYLVGSTQEHGYWYCTSMVEVALSNADKEKKRNELSHQIKQMVDSGLAAFGPQLPLL